MQLLSRRQISLVYDPTTLGTASIRASLTAGHSAFAASPPPRYLLREWFPPAKVTALMHATYPIFVCLSTACVQPIGKPIIRVGLSTS